MATRNVIPYTSIADENFYLKARPLPSHTGNADDYLNRHAHQGLKIQTICMALQQKCTLNTLKAYIHGFKDRLDLAYSMKRYGSPALYYAVERNSEEAVKILLQCGADPMNYEYSKHIPLIAFAIIHGHRHSINNTGIVKILLSYGTDPRVIPQDMWNRFLDMPKAVGPKIDCGPAAWCTEKAREILAPALHLTHRYLLHRASKIPEVMACELQIAEGNTITGLLKIPYFLIGQLPSTGLVQTRVYSYIANKDEKPLVMAFAGPSGHGKTELAKQLGDLLAVKHVVIPCNELRDKMDILGSSYGYSRSEQGSKLNNFLANNGGKTGVIILDEFDKTTEDVRDALLSKMDQGEHTDRRTEKTVDCSRIIWVIATNFGDDLIEHFYDTKIRHLNDDARDKFDLEPLQDQLRYAFRGTYGAPFTGRMRLMVPFLPFSHPEQAVVLHKFILDFHDRVRKPIDLREDQKRYIGHIDLQVIEDGKFCSKIAKKYYDTKLGARSLVLAVDNIEDKLVKEYKDTKTPVEEDVNDGPLRKYIARIIEAGDDETQTSIAVFKDEPEEEGEDV